MAGLIIMRLITCIMRHKKANYNKWHDYDWQNVSAFSQQSSR